MSPWWLEEVRVAIHAGGVDGAVLRRIDGKLLRHETVALGEEGGESLPALLPELLARLRVAKRPTRVVLSNALARFLVLPWQDVLGSEEEWLEFARHAYADIYGDAAADWRIRLASQGYGRPMLACAIEEELVQGVASAVRQGGARLAGMVPLFSAAFERFYPRLRNGQAWLAQVEPGSLCLARIEAGTVARIAIRRIRADGTESLSQVMAREIERSGFGAEAAPVFFHAAGQVSVPTYPRLARLDGIAVAPAGLAMALC